MIIESFTKPYCQMIIVDSLIVVGVVFIIIAVVGGTFKYLSNK